MLRVRATGGGVAVYPDERSRRHMQNQVVRGLAAALWSACLLFLALATNLSAQDPPEASSVLHASTCGWSHHDTTPEPAILLLIEEQLEDRTGYAAETARDGLSQLRRWFGACDGSASRQAVLEFRRAWDRESSDPAYRAALGVALARGIEVQPPGAQGHNYRPAYGQSNAERQARRLLAQALEEWHAPGLGQELAALALATRDNSTLEAAADALEDLSKRIPAEPSVWTTRAEIAIARQKYGDAVETAGTAAELGDPAGFRALGVVRLLRDDDPAQGAEMYLQGLAAADETTLYRYHEDIAPLLLLDELHAWEATAGEDRKAWLRDEWEWRASTSGRTVAERLAVHFRRLETAIDRFRRLAHRGARPAEAVVWDSLQLRMPYDDRGLIHIRHGEPDDIVRAPSGRMGPGKEAWIYYRLAGGRAAFEFRKLRDWTDYVLTPQVGCDPFVYMYGVGGARGEALYRAGEPPNTAWFEEFERGVLDFGLNLAIADPATATNAARCMAIVQKARYQDTGQPRMEDSDPILLELPYIRLMEATRRRDARIAAAEAFATETATPRFENFIQALSSIYAFRGRDNAADVVAFLLLPARQITPRQVDRGVEYPLRLSLAIEDPIAQQVQRMDTLLVFGAAQALEQEGQYMRTALQMRAEPVANATVRITVVNQAHPDEGQILVGTKTVPAFAPGELAMSDLVIAAAQPGAWRRGGVSISPLPGHQLAEGERFRLFHEVYGLEPNQTIRTRITIAPDTDAELLSRIKALFGSERVLELSFDESAQPGPDGVLQVERTIQPSLEPGRYTLEVAVELPTGETVTKATSVLFLEQGGR